MAVLTECTGCLQPSAQVLCGEAVFENSQCVFPAIPSTVPDLVVTATVDPTEFNIELACCRLAVVCGIIHKTITGTGYAGFTVDIPVQVTVNFPNDFDIEEPLNLSNLTITNVEICSGCYRLLCPTISDGITVFHNIREKDILLFAFTFTPTV